LSLSFRFGFCIPSFNMVLNQEKLARLQAASRTGTLTLATNCDPDALELPAASHRLRSTLDRAIY
jgi:hypothetical protein